MRIAEASLTTGASAADVTAAVLRMTDAYGLSAVHVDVTYTSIVLSYHRGPAADPVTAMRTVRSRSEDVDRLSHVQELIRDIVTERMSAAEARTRFDAIIARPALYRRWVGSVAQGVLAGGVAMLLGASYPVILAAALTSAVVGRLQAELLSRRLPVFFASMAGAAIPTAVALLLVGLRSRGALGMSDQAPSVVVAAGIVALLAGLSVVGAARDAIDGYYVTATARAFEVVVLTMALVAGIVFTLGLGRRVGVATHLVPAGSAAGSPGVQIVAATVIAGAFALAFSAPPRAVASCAAMGAFGWSGYLIAGAWEMAPGSASAVAALLVGLAGHALSVRVRIPWQTISTAGIVALLPGMMVFSGLYQLVQAPSVTDAAAGLLTLVEAAAIGLALAGGVGLGGYLGRAVRLPQDRFADRALRRASRRP